MESWVTARLVNLWSRGSVVSVVSGLGGLGSSVGFGGLWDSGALWDSGGSVGLCGSLWSLWSLCLGSRGSGVSNRKSLGFGVSGLVGTRKKFFQTR